MNVTFDVTMPGGRAMKVTLTEEDVRGLLDAIHDKKRIVMLNGRSAKQKRSLRRLVKRKPATLDALAAA